MRQAAVALLAVFFAGSVLQAQEFRGTISGRVLDAQDAVVPNARIVAVHVETGARYQTVTTAEGQYALPYLAPGQYNVSAQADGFKRHLNERVQVSTNERVALEIKLELGQLAETVTVTETAGLLQAATASIGQVINTQQIENMPLNGRSPLVLAQLAYGVVPNIDPKQSRPYDDSRQSNFTMGGAPSGKNEMLLDGAPDTGEAGRIAFSPPVDSVVEVKVESFQSDAAYGHTGGGTINMVTKSGTNAFHGVASDYNQVSRLAATPFFTNRAGQPKPVTRYNQWGTGVGGPVILPKLLNGRNRLFFYFAYEGIRTGLPLPTTLTVPTAAGKTGDLSGLLAAGANYQIYDPLTASREGSRTRRQPFPNNVVPANRISPIAKKLLDYYPLPNQAGRPDGRDNFLSNLVNDDRFHSETGRIDWNASDRHKLFFNFRENNRDLLNNDYFANIATGTRLNQYNWGSMLDHVYTLSPTMVLNSRFNWSRNGEVRGTKGDGFDFTALGLPASLAQQAPRIAFPAISLGSMSGIGAGQRLNNPFDSFQIFTSVTKIAGLHNVKWGADLRLVRFSSTNFGNSSGSYSFGNAWTNGPLDNSPAAPIGQDLTALLLGLPTGGSFDLNAGQTAQAGYYALFLQDDLRLRPDLTLNLGLRYERDTPTTERFDRSAKGFDFETPNPISAAAGAAYARSPIPEVPASQFRTPGGLLFASASQRSLYETGAHYFSPRFGFAWKPAVLGSRTVIRGGSGVFFYSLGKSGVDQTGFSQSTPIVPTLDGYLTPNATLANPYPGGLLQPTGSSLGLSTYLGRDVGSTLQDRQNPYSVRWNLNIQHELPGNMVVEIGYFGNHAVHLEGNRNLNYVPRQYLSTSPVRDQATIDALTALVSNPFATLIPGANLNGSTVQRQQLLLRFPEFTGVTQRLLPEGSSYFHSLQARYEKRFSHGVQLLANYFFGKLIERTDRLNASDPAPAKRIGVDDRPQRVVMSGSWDVPAGMGKAWLSGAGRLLDRVAGGWNVNAIYTWQPGRPLSWGNVIYYGGDLRVNPRGVDGAFDVTRFNRNSREQLDSNLRSFPAGFANLRSDGLNNFDLSVVKRIPVAEKIYLQFRCEFFNFLNHPVFEPPNTSPTNSSFSLINTQANLPRTTQMALRLVW